MFNTLKYAKKLEAVGVTREQAEAHIQIIADIVEGDVATKEDLNKLGAHLDIQLKDIRNEMAQLEYRMIIKLGALVTAIVATAVAILKIH